MNAVGWVAVAYILTRGTVDVTKAGLGYRTTKRNAVLKAQADARKAATS